MTAEQWNQTYSVGQQVRLKETGGSVFVTTTKTQAFNLGINEPVVVLRGRQGAFPLTRVDALVNGYCYNGAAVSPP